MEWFLAAFLAPVLWGIVNIADDYLVANFSNKEKERSSGGLALFSSFVGILVAYGIWIFSKNVFDIPFLDKLLLSITGALTLAWIVLYLYALEMEDVSAIAPWFLTVPVFGYVLGYFILGENLSLYQLIGSGVIFSGVAIVSLNWGEEKSRIKWKPVFYILLACLLIAISGVIFKFVTVSEENFWVSSFWEYFGLAITGLLVYFFSPKYRNEFENMNKSGGWKIFTINIITEIFTIAGNILTNFALLLAPVAIVYLIGSFQPAVVLLLAIFCTKFFPKIIQENMAPKILIPKIVAIVLMILGSFLLFL